MNEDVRLPDEAAPEVVAEEVAETPEVVEETTEETTVKAEEGDSPPPQDEVEKSESQRRRERRIEHAKELKRKAEESQQALDRIKKAGEADAEPKEDEYEDYTEYVAARAVWSAARKTDDRQAAVVQAEIEALEAQRTAEVDAVWQDRTAEAKTRLQNFEQVAFSNIPVTAEMGDTIKRAENGPDVLYHLGSNPAVAHRIASMDSIEQVFELGRISAELKAPKPITQSSAPDPIKPVGGRASPQKDPSKMSNDEYRQWRANGGGR